MSATYEITEGPFAGTTLDCNRLQPWRYSNGTPVVINGKEMSEWSPDYLTPIFLRAFDPQLGWSVTLDLDVMEGLKLPDYANPLVENGVTVKTSFGADVPSMLQVIKVTAKLTDPLGKVIHSVSILQGVNNINSAELGLKRALLQLYRGTGLPSSPEGHTPMVVHQMPAENQPQAQAVAVQRQDASPVTKTNGFQVRAISQAVSRAEGDDRDAGVVEQEGSLETENPLGEPGNNSAQVEVASTSELDQVATSTAEQEVTPAAATDAVNNNHIEKRVLAQITHYAKLAGVEVRQLKDDADAKGELVALRRQANKR